MERPSSSGSPRRHKLLVVDDNPDLLATIESALGRSSDYQVVAMQDPSEALERLRGEVFDLCLLDIRMPVLDGVTLLGHCRRAQPEAAVILMTAYASVEQAVEMMRLGADYYLAKPFSPGRLRETVARVLDRAERRSPAASEPLFLTADPATRGLLAKVSAAAESEASVLILGESGTGKELLARSLHRLSHRRNGPFEVLNSAAVPETLVEAMLFGYERGSFTGADRSAEGRIESASGGTLFFDEVGDMTLMAQAKILRVLQDRQVQRLGGTTPRTVDVRYVFATNRNLRTLLEERAFREDLFYRISVIELAVPPLRHRPADVRLLTEQFLARFAAEVGREPVRLSDGAWEVFLKARWPGNVRQLENTCWRLALFAAPGAEAPPDLAAQIVAGTGIPSPEGRVKGADRQEVEAAIAASQGNLTRAAARLGISRPTLYARLRLFGLPLSRRRPE